MAGLNTLNDLFENELRDLYDAEKRVLKALPKMVKAASDDQLREAFEHHEEETRGQVERLEQVFESLDLKVRGKRCSGMEGILEEGADLMKKDGDEAVLDAGLIAAAQRVEHYEITSYGTLMAWAKVLGFREAIRLLGQNEQEEKNADRLLSELAESMVNRQAAGRAGEGEEEEEADERPARGTRARTARGKTTRPQIARAADRGRRR